MMSLGVSLLKTFSLSTTFSSHKVHPSPSFGRSSLKGQICMYGPKTEACKKYVEIPTPGGEEKYSDMYMAMNIITL